MHRRILQMGAGERVQRAERFIHQQHFGLHRQRAGNADALLHAAGDLAGPLVERVPHLHPLQVVNNPLPALRLIHGFAKYLIHRQRHVLKAGEPGQ